MVAKFSAFGRDHGNFELIVASILPKRGGKGKEETAEDGPRGGAEKSATKDKGVRT